MRAYKNKFRRYSFTGLPVFVLTALAAILLLSTPALAHHIRGLPHYSYKDNYQQIPLVEEERKSGDWRTLFSYVKAFETKHYLLAMYIKNLKTDEPFKGIVNFKVFGADENPDKVMSYNASPDITNTYKAGWSYEKDGMYTVRIKFSDGERTYTEDFMMQAGQTTFNYLWLAIPGFIIVSLFGLTVAKRMREKRGLSGQEVP